jgi:phage-related protein
LIYLSRAGRGIKRMEIITVFYRTASGREPVREYIESLSKEDQALIANDLEIIRDHGFKDTTVETRKLQGKQFKGRLWEIKTGKGNQQRLFYCVIQGHTLVLLHACKKQKEGGQSEDLEKAAKRMKDVL